MPKLYMLVGIPCSGKSTWISKQDWAKDCVVVSTDNYIDRIAKESNKTYNDVFFHNINAATKVMYDDVENARSLGKDIIWDQTNLTVNSRKTKLQKLPEYRKISFTFLTPDLEELNRRLNSRVGKIISSRVVHSMITSLTYPTPDEGFDEVYIVAEGVNWIAS